MDRQVAVALKYEPERDAAPRVVAKGRGLVAEAIMRIRDDSALRQRLGEAGHRRVIRKFDIESNVAAAVRDFESYAEKYEENPELLIQSLWIDTKLEIFARKDVEKVIIPPGQRTVIKVSRDPDIARKTKARQLEAGITPPNTGANQWSPPKPPNP